MICLLFYFMKMIRLLCYKQNKLVGMFSPKKKKSPSVCKELLFGVTIFEVMIYFLYKLCYNLITWAPYLSLPSNLPL